VSRAARKLSRPVRAVLLAVLVHVAVGALLGLSLRFQPVAVRPGVVKPVQAIVIDRSAIEAEKKKDKEKKRQEQEKKRKADEEKRKKSEEKRKAEEKKKKQAKAKRKKEAEKKRKAEEKKRKAEEKKQKQAEAKRKKEAEKKRKAKEKKKREEAERRAAEEAREREEQEAYSALRAMVGEIKGKIEDNWSNRMACGGQEVTISVKVALSGEVESVKVLGGDADDACRRSAEYAVRKASPLPFPDNPRYYKWLDTDIQFIFRP
ncbi:uncharacterized protein METZ01_LOCUS84237, partial [marine metagenome]